jgi:hypothetical protein
LGRYYVTDATKDIGLDFKFMPVLLGFLINPSDSMFNVHLHVDRPTFAAFVLAFSWPAHTDDIPSCLSSQYYYTPVYNPPYITLSLNTGRQIKFSNLFRSTHEILSVGHSTFMD